MFLLNMHMHGLVKRFKVMFEIFRLNLTTYIPLLHGWVATLV